MNKTDLKRLRIDDRYVIEPTKFLIRMGVECSSEDNKITIHDLHYILQNRLYHAGIKSVSADKIYRGEIVLVGKPNKFYPYYNPIRCDLNICCEVEVEKDKVKQIIDLNKLSISELYRLYNDTGEFEYFNEIFNRTYHSLEEEQLPTRQKLYLKTKKERAYSIDKSK